MAAGLIIPALEGLGAAASWGYRAYRGYRAIEGAKRLEEMVRGGNAVLNESKPEECTGSCEEEYLGEQDEKSKTQGRRRISGPLSQNKGGTGNAETDFDTLTGGKNSPAAADSSLPSGSRVGENGMIYRPGSTTSGPRIDVPASGTKSHETLHY